MVLKLIEEDWPLDRVAFYDTGMEFNAIYRNWEKLKEVQDAHDIEHITLHPERPFLYDMLEKPIESKENGKHCGYGWCGGVTRWGTRYRDKVHGEYGNLHDLQRVFAEKEVMPNVSTAE